MKLCTDNKAWFDVISKRSLTSEKRLIFDIAAALEGFINHEISDIWLVRSMRNIKNGFTKLI